MDEERRVLRIEVSSEGTKKRAKGMGGGKGGLSREEERDEREEKEMTGKKKKDDGLDHLLITCARPVWY